MPSAPAIALLPKKSCRSRVSGPNRGGLNFGRISLDVKVSPFYLDIKLLCWSFATDR
jgi:hypothetical protein